MNNGAQMVDIFTAQAPYFRRSGRSSSITSREGIDGRFRPCVQSSKTYTARPLTLLQPALEGIQNRTNTTSSSTVWKTYIYGCEQQAHALRYSRFTAAADAVNLSFASVQWEGLAATALSTMLPSFHSKNSLVNFLIELKDFKGVVKYLFNNIDQKFNHLAGLLGYLRSDKPLAKIAKSHLSIQFGWKPFVNDLVTFMQTIVGFEARYRELMQREGKPQQSYWGTWISGTAIPFSTVYWNTPSVDGPGSWVGPFQGGYSVRVVQEASEGIRYHATVRYRYEMPEELRSAAGKLKAYLDVLGIAPNAATIWNAIPFSFLVDWIVNVSGYLERLRVDNIDFKTEILDFCHSAKIMSTVSMSLSGKNYRYPTGYYYTAGATVDQCDSVLYERKLGIPNYLTAIQSSGLNPREFSLAGALLRANKKR